jgi:hypothetical protein
MNISDIADNIKSSPHCRFNLKPIDYQANRIEKFSDLENIINSKVVRFRGWDFPHTNRERIIKENQNIGSADDWRRKELWKFYQSGQFIYLFQFHEDFYTAEAKSMAYRWIKKYDPSFKENGYFDYEAFIAMITEIIEFSNRIYRDSNFQSPIEMSISLININGRIFTSIDPMRSNRYFLIQTNELKYEIKLDISNLTEIIQSTIECIIWFLERFGLTQISNSNIQVEVEKIRSRHY